MSFPSFVKLVEVSPRDGFQNESQVIPTKIKIDFINQLSETGLKVIEATSFVSSKRIPQLSDNQEVFQQIKKYKNVHYPVLIPNLRGLEDALTVGVTDIAVFTSPSEQFNQHNIHCSVDESLYRIEEVITKAKQHHLRIRGYLSCIAGCPYEGEILPSKVAALVDTLYKMGCEEISLGDTIGIGTPNKIKKVLELTMNHIPQQSLAVHFHDTYGQALANIYAVLECGVSIVDCSVAGLGGCPYAKGASGNVSTEDVLYMLQGLDIDTGVDLQKLIAAGKFIALQLGREPFSKVSRALG